ncbi:hypothetical protein PYH66_12925 [Staphylococcus delphini]|uniref:hypothetical protein n=1 Tax=Staphylococcus delphini TaxID=53344 RepID=UPI00336504F2
MENIIFNVIQDTWKAVMVIFLIYLFKEFIRIMAERSINIKRIESETQIKFSEKLLDQKAPVYMKHFSELKKAIGYYRHIAINNKTFEEWDNKVYMNLFGDYHHDNDDLENAYRISLGYRYLSNFQYYLNEFKASFNKASNEFSLNQLYIPDRVICGFQEVKDITDKKIYELDGIIKELSEKNNLSDEEFINGYKEIVGENEDKDYLYNLERYLDNLKIEFYKEYNVKVQQDYIIHNSQNNMYKK